VADYTRSDRDKAKRFPGAFPRAQLNLPPICDAENDWRKLPALRGAALKRFWSSVFEKGRTTIEGSRNDRLLAAWRLTRLMAVVRGVIQPNEPLGETMGDGQPEVYQTDFRSFIDIQDWATKSLLGKEGVPLAPPHIATNLLRNGEVAEDYEPEKDERLTRFVGLVAYLGQASLQLDQSESARRGFEWFIDPGWIRVAWPSPPALFQFEAELVSEAIEIVTDMSAAHARKEIAAKWDLTYNEVSQVIFLARRAMKVALDADDLAGHKAVVCARLEKTYDAAIEAMDHRGAALAAREFWRIMRDKGEAQAEDELGEMDAVIQAGATRKRLSRPKD
jgi:hypothetical protein